MDSPNKNSPRKRKRMEGTITASSLKYFSIVNSDEEKEQVEIGANGETNSKENKKTHICSFCKQKLNGLKEWNLVSHLKSCRRDIFIEISMDKNESIPVKRLKLLQSCTEIVSINGRPFAFLHDSGFESVVKKELNDLRNGNHPLDLSDVNLTVVKEHLSQTANKVRNHIELEVKNRPLSLLCDIVTKHNRSMLGVSVQYTMRGALNVRSIGLIELIESHTGKYLAEVIIQRLALFGIHLKQIISITTDNGKNILKMVKDAEFILQEQIRQAQQNHDENQIDEDMVASAVDTNEEEIDAAIDELLAESSEITDEEALQQINDAVFDDEIVILNSNEQLLNEMSDEIRNNGANVVWEIERVYCAAHTLQLGLKDGMQKLKKQHKNIISLCRQACKFLRLKSTSLEMEKLGLSYRLPRLENATRWGSMFLMVCCALFLISSNRLLNVIECIFFH